MKNMNEYVPGSMSIGTSWVTMDSWNKSILLNSDFWKLEGLTNLASFASFKIFEGYTHFERSRRLIQNSLDVLRIFVVLLETRAFTLKDINKFLEGSRRDRDLPKREYRRLR
jgi:hypothetical protein